EYIMRHAEIDVLIARYTAPPLSYNRFPFSYNSVHCWSCLTWPVFLSRFLPLYPSCAYFLSIAFLFISKGVIQKHFILTMYNLLQYSFIHKFLITFRQNFQQFLKIPFFIIF